MAAPPPLSPQMQAFQELCSQNKGLDLVGTMSAFITLTIVVLTLRVYVRVAVARAWGWDDALMVISLVTFNFDQILLSRLIRSSHRLSV